MVLHYQRRKAIVHKVCLLLMESAFSVLAAYNKWWQKVNYHSNHGQRYFVSQLFPNEYSGNKVESRWGEKGLSFGGK